MPDILLGFTRNDLKMYILLDMLEANIEQPYKRRKNNLSHVELTIAPAPASDMHSFVAT